MNTKRTMTRAGLALTATLAFQGAAQAAYIDTYFAQNYMGGEVGVLDIVSVTYQGAGGVETVAMPDMLDGVVDFQGLPDYGRNPATGPVYPVQWLDLPLQNLPPASTGDGSSTRWNGSTVSINWDTTNPLLPTITILSFDFDHGSPGFPNVSTATMQGGGYLLGLIPFGSETVPGSPNTELGSFLGPIQGDIYAFAGDKGGVGNAIGEALAPDLTSQSLSVIFGAASAQVVPVPAAVWLFGSGLALLGGLRRRANQRAAAA